MGFAFLSAEKSYQVSSKKAVTSSPVRKT